MWAQTPCRELAQHGRGGASVNLHCAPHALCQEDTEGRACLEHGSWGHRGRAPEASGQTGELVWDLQGPLMPGVPTCRRGSHVTRRGVCLFSSYFLNKFYFRPVFDLQNHLQRLPVDSTPSCPHRPLTSGPRTYPSQGAHTVWHEPLRSILCSDFLHFPEALFLLRPHLGHPVTFSRVSCCCPLR